MGVGWAKAGDRPGEQLLKHLNPGVRGECLLLKTVMEVFIS